MDARGKFGEHERSIRVARGAAESNSSFLSAGNAEIVVFRRMPQFHFASVEIVNCKQNDSVRS